MKTKTTNWLQLLGPGLLFAGAAIGVSHLVLSTKAGANFGFGLIWLVILANLMKYPFFEYGPRYAMATGESLLQGYKRSHPLVLGIFIVVTLGTMFTVQAAVTIVTASLATYLSGWDNMVVWELVILLFSAGLLYVGKYQLLDTLMKVIIICLTIITLIAVLIAAINYSPKNTALSWAQYFAMDATALGFFAVFTGWMPAPLDLSVWHSLWTLEKQKVSKDSFSPRRSIFDFNVGYIGTTILALFFLALGALVMFGSGESFSPKAAVFAQQLIGLYTDTLGSGVAVFVSIAAFITMFSTTITCLDALPRAMGKAHYLLFQPPSSASFERLEAPKKYYWGWLIGLIAGSMVLLSFFLKDMGNLIYIATILSFVTTPFFAIINTYLVSRKKFPTAHRPPQWMLILSWVGIVYLILFCGLYFWSLFN